MAEKKENVKSIKSELIRKRYLYREMILKRKASLSHRAAIKLIGPDTAYHLYRYRDNG
jgi:hypothetical protein